MILEISRQILSSFVLILLFFMIFRELFKFTSFLTTAKRNTRDNKEDAHFSQSNISPHFPAPNFIEIEKGEAKIGEVTAEYAAYRCIKTDLMYLKVKIHFFDGDTRPSIFFTPMINSDGTSIRYYDWDKSTWKESWLHFYFTEDPNEVNDEMGFYDSVTGVTYEVTDIPEEEYTPVSAAAALTVILDKSGKPVIDKQSKGTVINRSKCQNADYNVL